jgi:hypothetical protein
MVVDYKKYLQVCQDAVNDPSVFNTFRSHTDYAGVVETMAERHWGIPYVKILKERFPFLWKKIDIFASGDSICGAKCFEYDGVKISPITLRYVKVLADLMSCFGSLDGMSIIEIGGGYGGQCKIIQDFYKIKSYTLVDLPDPLILANMWLNANRVGGTVFRSTEDRSTTEYDLCISNYAFTEFDRDTQKKYVNAILRNSKKGYIICNFFNGPEDGVPKMRELLDVHKDYLVIPEEPETASGNFVFIW